MPITTYPVNKELIVTYANYRQCLKEFESVFFPKNKEEEIKHSLLSKALIKYEEDNFKMS